MSALLASGHLVDLVLVLVLLEGMALAVFHARTGRGIPPADALFLLAPGLCLMLALRAALVAHLGLVAVWLAASLIAHVADLRRRWRE